MRIQYELSGTQLTVMKMHAAWQPPRSIFFSISGASTLNNRHNRCEPRYIIDKESRMNLTQFRICNGIPRKSDLKWTK